MELRVTTREVLGKKVRFLRREGIIPVHLFGHGIKSEALQCDATELQHILAQAGKTRLIGLKLDKSKKPRNVVVRETQRDPRTGKLLHVDFYQVRMTEKIKVEVPIVLIGEAPALKTKGNMLIQELNSLAIECLPEDIPASVEVDLDCLTEAEQAIHVKDIMLGEGISVFNEPEHVVAKISLLPVEKVEVEEEVEEELEEEAEEAVEAPEAVSESVSEPAQLPEEEPQEE